MKILHASLLYTCINYSIVFIPCVKTCLSSFSLSLSPSFFTLKYDHSNIAIHMWHPLSDESSLTSPPSSYMKHAATPKGRGSCSNIVEYQFFPKLENSSVSIIILASLLVDFFHTDFSFTSCCVYFAISFI